MTVPVKEVKLPRRDTRWLVAVVGFGVAMTLPVGCDSERGAADGRADSLQGAWVVTAVQREGQSDPLQVGALLLFTSGRVKFRPKVVQFADGGS